MTRRASVILAGGSLAVIALFSLVMSLLAEDGRWPQLTPGALRGVDLVAGFAVAIGLIVLLVRPRGRGIR